MLLLNNKNLHGGSNNDPSSDWNNPIGGANDWLFDRYSRGTFRDTKVTGQGGRQMAR